MSSTHISFHPFLKIVVKITNLKKRIFQGQQKKLWEQKICAKLRAT